MYRNIISIFINIRHKLTHNINRDRYIIYFMFSFSWNSYNQRRLMPNKVFSLSISEILPLDRAQYPDLLL